MGQSFSSNRATDLVTNANIYRHGILNEHQQKALLAYHALLIANAGSYAVGQAGAINYTNIANDVAALPTGFQGASLDLNALQAGLINSFDCAVTAGGAGITTPTSVSDKLTAARLLLARDDNFLDAAFILAVYQAIGGA